MVTIIHANIITPSHIIEDGTLIFDKGIITAIQEKSVASEKDSLGEVWDAQGQYLSPGFIDIHVHGGGGADFMDNSVDAFLQVAETHARYGTTAMLPTTLTSDKQQLWNTFTVYEQARKENIRGAQFLGLHLEGPYFAMNQRGAQDPKYIRDPDPDEYQPILKKYGHLIARWSAAPELPGADAFGKAVTDAGILLALAHTDALYEDILRGLESGYKLATHFYSGMSGMIRKNAYRYAGAIESCLLLDEIDVEIIADGVHLPDPFLKLILKVKGVDHITLITDAMRAAGMPEGNSILGGLDTGLPVIVEDGVAKLPDRSSFAGSVGTADRLLRTMLATGVVSLVDAVKMLTLNPAKLLRVDHERGCIAKGMRADLVLFDEHININKTIVGGRTVYSAS
ncbi:N-acetylglucosamine-6-phosphate deacetylase [Sphingobacterium deserti]|uniref:N-acetylglucosamine-6-phosphate deacetylase n=1 Tax=Sphingobacterium deserti TaxID=1229276 RepID=A0A0B8T6Q9_9SPHI|nr:N-acetylglucosamine-6-phosphate deacetylase [Sphingobacterium deserti]KGE13080.1 N-acetylglucosamine-6-phosphate deacetylase [Sphingobacterium deserti]